jgi:hypothetical protein
MSRGAECIALRGCGAAAGLFALPAVVDLPRVEVGLLFVPLADEPRMAKLEAAMAIGT